MAVAKMQALADFLKAKNLFAVEQFDFYMENGTSEVTSKRVGKGFEISRFRYDAIFSVERFSGDADVFLVLINIWLMENDNNRDQLELESPKVDVTTLDDQTVDVEVSITFDESITIVPDDAGSILFKGARYSVAPAEIIAARKVAVGDNQQRQPDKPFERPAD